VLGEERDAHARPDVHDDPREPERARERGAQLARDGRRLLGVGAAQEDAELVAPEARDDVALAQRLAQPRADAAQQLVADVVAERVVELLELVEVDHQQRERLLGRDRGLDVGRERAAVAQAGEVVGQRQLARHGQRGGLAQQQRHAHHHGQQREHRERDRDRVEVDRLPIDEHGQRDRAEGAGEEQRAAVGADDRGAARRHPRRRGQEQHGQRPQRVVRVAGDPAAVRAVDRVHRVHGDEHAQAGHEQRARAARPPARAGEHRGEEGEQRDVGERVGGGGHRGTGGGVEARQRRLESGGGDGGAEGQAAEQAVDPHADAAAREALAPEEHDARVEAQVGAEPQRVADRRHGRDAAVDEVVDDPARRVEADAEADGQPRGPLARQQEGARDAQAGGQGEDRGEVQVPGKAVGTEAEGAVRDVGGQRDDGQRPGDEEPAPVGGRERGRRRVAGHARVVGPPVPGFESG
jgi:hypothetical protein